MHLLGAVLLVFFFFLKFIYCFAFFSQESLFIISHYTNDLHPYTCTIIIIMCMKCAFRSSTFTMKDERALLICIILRQSYIPIVCYFRIESKINEKKTEKIYYWILRAHTNVWAASTNRQYQISSISTKKNVHAIRKRESERE